MKRSYCFLVFLSLLILIGCETTSSLRSGKGLDLESIDDKNLVKKSCYEVVYSETNRRFS